MERNTLSFFTRLFSLKKKKVLEKRDKENVLKENEKYNIQESSILYRDSARNESNQNPLEIDSSNIDADTIIREASSQINDKSISKIYTPYDNLGKSAQGYADDINSTLSLVKNSGQDISDEIGIQDRFCKEQESRQKSSEYDAYSPDNDLDKDDCLEYNSMVLLSKLEQLTIKLSDNSIQKSMPIVTENLVEMANHVIEFAEVLPVPEQKKISLEMLINRDQQNYRILNSKYIDNERLLIDISTFVNGNNAQEMFIDLSNDLLRIINVYLSASIKAFKSNRISEQWKTLYAGFFVNLSKSVRNSQAMQKN